MKDWKQDLNIIGSFIIALAFFYASFINRGDWDFGGKGFSAFAAGFVCIQLLGISVQLDHLHRKLDAAAPKT